MRLGLTNGMLPLAKSDLSSSSGRLPLICMSRSARWRSVPPHFKPSACRASLSRSAPIGSGGSPGLGQRLVEWATQAGLVSKGPKARRRPHGAKVSSPKPEQRSNAAQCTKAQQWRTQHFQLVSRVERIQVQRASGCAVSLLACADVLPALYSARTPLFPKLGLQLRSRADQRADDYHNMRPCQPPPTPALHNRQASNCRPQAPLQS